MQIMPASGALHVVRHVNVIGLGGVPHHLASGVVMLLHGCSHPQTPATGQESKNAGDPYRPHPNPTEDCGAGKRGRRQTGRVTPPLVCPPTASSSRRRRHGYRAARGVLCTSYWRNSAVREPLRSSQQDREDHLHCVRPSSRAFRPWRYRPSQACIWRTHRYQQ
jgi:hypothetical protein